jgi:phytoene dehydrogenase-like protein
MADAVVIGSGPNGLVAANVLADHGWDVLVLEAEASPGGAVRSGEIARPGFVSDLFSAFYPLAAASPVLAAMDLEAHGLRWRRAPLVVAHPMRDGRVATLSTDLDRTAEGLDGLCPGDGRAWRDLYRRWRRVAAPLMDALLRPFPPVRPAARLVARLGPRELLRFARFAVLPVRRMAEEEFRGEAPGLLLAGNALHSDLSPEATLSGFFGWLLACLGQQLGFPVPEGGAGRLTDALVGRLEERGGRIRGRAPVARIVVERGRAVAVRLQDGEEIPAARAVVADVAAPALYLDLVGPEHLPRHLLDDVRRFQFDNATVKVDWALSGPVPWRNPVIGEAGTVHLAEDMDRMTTVGAQLAMGLIPDRPYLVMGQMARADPTRQPPGTETAWAYTHVPRQVRGDAGGSLRGRWEDGAETEAFVARVEREVEALAPGFSERILGRHVLTPLGMQAANRSLVLGALNGGTAQLHQQLVFRPVPGLARPETPVRGLYLASASAHPGGGVHGAAGANAASAAIWGWRRRRVVVAAGGGGRRRGRRSPTARRTAGRRS